MKNNAKIYCQICLLFGIVLAISFVIISVNMANLERRITQIENSLNALETIITDKQL